MTTYRVTVKAPAREVYLVDANNPEEAARGVYIIGALLVSEVEVGEVVSVEEGEG